MLEAVVPRRAAGSTVRVGPFPGGLRCYRWSGWGVGHGDDGGGDAGAGVLRGGVREGRRGLGLAGAVPVTVEGIPAAADFPGHGLVAGVPEADRGQDRPGGRPGSPAPFPFLAGTAGRAASRTVPRVIPVPAARAASSCRTRSGVPERSIGPAPGAAPRSGALASRSAVSAPSHRHL